MAWHTVGFTLNGGVHPVTNPFHHEMSTYLYHESSVSCGSRYCGPCVFDGPGHCCRSSGWWIFRPFFTSKGGYTILTRLPMRWWILNCTSKPLPLGKMCTPNSIVSVYYYYYTCLIFNSFIQLLALFRAGQGRAGSDSVSVTVTVTATESVTWSVCACKCKYECKCTWASDCVSKNKSINISKSKKEK